MKTTAALSDSPGGTDNNSQETVVHSIKHLLSFKKNKGTITKEVVVFIVDDDLLFTKALEHSITEKLPSVDIKTFQTGEACLQHMKLNPEIVILDYYLNSTVPYAWNGLTILKQLKKINPALKVIMVSSQDSLDIAVKCIDNGSFDYISKSESAFVKINNVLTNIIQDIKTNNRSIKPYQIISMIIIIILAVFFLLK